jgi:carbohydrate kinase (thermoresistant glucokinase family)
MMDLRTAAPLIVVMGVSGCGKSTIGAALADRLGVHFIDGDALHPVSNIEKMSHGVALEDLDRLPWLADVGRTLRDHQDTGLVLACSALKRSYRDVIRWEAPDVTFVHAHGERSLLHERLSGRADHFMPATLLASQLNTLELLDETERGFVVDIRLPVADLVESALPLITSPERSSCPSPLSS